MDKRPGANADIIQKLERIFLKTKKRGAISAPHSSLSIPIQMSFGQKQARNQD